MLPSETSSLQSPSQVATPLPVVIIGAGPAGLTAAYQLTQANCPVTLFDRDTQVGGLSRTVWYKGYGFDIGGHRFFTKMDRIQAMWTDLLGPDFIRVPRLSRIYYRNRFFNYPLKPWNALFGLGIFNSTRVVVSYIWRQLRPLAHEEFFEQYVINRFGDRLYTIFFKTYTEKVWGIPCTEIRSDWAAQRIKGLNLVQAIKSAFVAESGSKVKSLIEEFDYPRLGPGMLWERMEDKIAAGGGQCQKRREVVQIDHDGQRILRLIHAASDNLADQQEVVGSFYLSTMPLRTMLLRMNPLPPDNVLQAAKALRYRDFITVNLILDNTELFPDNWIYVHSPSVRVGRIQNFRNWSKDLVPEAGHTGIGMEYFCFEGDDLWNMDDEALVLLARKELKKLGLARKAKVTDGFVIRVKKAYPMYDEKVLENLGIIRQWIDKFDNLQQIGRNGLHRYNNQDHSMLTGIYAAENLLHNAGHDIWSVNTDSEYQETKQAGRPAQFS